MKFSLTTFSRTDLITSLVIAVLAGAYWLIFTGGKVEKGKIEFTAIPYPDVYFIDELINHVDVRMLDVNIRSRSPDFFASVLWDLFANNPHEISFNNITTKDWYARWESFSKRLCEKAETQKLGGENLKACLAKIAPNKGDTLAKLPVAAYLCKSGDVEVWIIVCKWEYDSVQNTDAGPEHSKMAHCRFWALRAADQKELGFKTCQ